MSYPYDESILRATPHTLANLELVAEERRRQEKKWGEQNHDPFLYLTILGEEYGEACEAALRSRFPGKVDEADRELVMATIRNDLRMELVQVAAVAVAMLECLDRGTWNWGGHAQ